MNYLHNAKKIWNVKNYFQLQQLPPNINRLILNVKELPLNVNKLPSNVNKLPLNVKNYLYV